MNLRKDSFSNPFISLVSVRLICTLYTSGAVYGYTYQATKAVIMESESRKQYQLLKLQIAVGKAVVILTNETRGLIGQLGHKK